MKSNWKPPRRSLEIPVWIYTIGTPLLSLLVIFRILQRATHTLRTGKY